MKSFDLAYQRLDHAGPANDVSPSGAAIKSLLLFPLPKARGLEAVFADLCLVLAIFSKSTAHGNFLENLRESPEINKKLKIILISSEKVI